MTDLRGKWAVEAADELPPRLWRDRLYVGTASAVCGPSGTLKSTFALKVAAEVSRTVGPVIVCMGEDGESVVRHRLEAAGADMAGVRLADYFLPYDLAELERDISSMGAVLAIFDTASKYLDVPIHKSADKTARVLMPVTRMLERTGCHLMLVEHSLKHTRGFSSPLAAIPDGIARTIRTGILFGFDPDDADRRAAAWVKDSYAEAPLGMAFSIDDSYEVDDGSGAEPRKIVAVKLEDDSYEVPDPLRLVAVQGGRGTAETAQARAQAAQWLVEKLSVAPMPVRDCDVCPTDGHVRAKGSCPVCNGAVTGVTGLESMAEADGVKWRTIRRAADAIGIVKGSICKTPTPLPKGEGVNTYKVAFWRLPDGHPKAPKVVDLP
jgi:hypothetical protein